MNCWLKMSSHAKSHTFSPTQFSPISSFYTYRYRYRYYTVHRSTPSPSNNCERQRTWSHLTSPSLRWSHPKWTSSIDDSDETWIDLQRIPLQLAVRLEKLLFNFAHLISYAYRTPPNLTLPKQLWDPLIEGIMKRCEFERFRGSAWQSWRTLLLLNDTSHLQGA